MPSVLIVDRSDDAREILSTALESRGVSTLQAARPRDGLDLARRARPDLIVLDLEAHAAGDHDCQNVAREARRRQTPVIVLGTVRQSAVELPAGDFVRKPYHYGPLLRKIEELLSGPGPVASGS